MEQQKKNDQQAGKIFGLVFGLVFFLVGLGVLGWGFKSWRLTQSSKNWPVAEGRIVSSEVKSHWSGSSSGSHSSSRKVYSADINYGYKVDSREYVSGKISFADYSGPRAHAVQTVEKYPRGKRVQVFYSPGDPSVSVLEPGKTGGLFIPFIAGGLFSLIGGTIVRAGLSGQLKFSTEQKT